MTAAAAATTIAAATAIAAATTAAAVVKIMSHEFHCFMFSVVCFV